jgi:hypothetical protein
MADPLGGAAEPAEDTFLRKFLEQKAEHPHDEEGY